MCKLTHCAQNGGLMRPGKVLPVLLVLVLGCTSTHAAPDLLDYQCADPMCGMMSFDFLHTRLTSVINGGLSSRECTRNDYGGLLPMACDEASKTRTLIPFLRPPAVCNGGTAPPPIVHKIPCSLQCGSGHYLDIPELRSKKEEPQKEEEKKEEPKKEEEKKEEEKKEEEKKEDEKKEDEKKEDEKKEEPKKEEEKKEGDAEKKEGEAPAADDKKDEAKPATNGDEQMAVMSVETSADSPAVMVMSTGDEPAVCRECQPGESSRGGAVVWDKWNHWPLQFLTTCDQPRGWCSPWVLNGTSVHSGDNEYNHDMTTELILEVNIVVPGQVTFTYRVDAEAGYDYLQFYDNNEPMLGYRGVSHQKYYTAVNFPLDTTGHHTLRWVYKKDSDYSGGDDRAEIRDIMVEGVAFAAIQCEPCAPGTFSDKPKSSKCTECPRDTFSKDPGAKECKACPANQYSKRGSSECIDRPACKDSDFIQESTKCHNGKRDTRKKLDPGHICDPGRGYKPEEWKEESCDAPVCNPGTFRKEGEWSCEFCPDHTFSAGGTNEAKDCESCKPGTSAIREWHWTDFTIPPTDVDTGCVGSCNNDKWISADSYMTSGIGHGDDAQIWYEFGLFMEMAGEVTVDFSLFCDKPGSEFIFYVDAEKQRRFSCYADEKLDRGASRTIKVPKGYHRLAWLFKRIIGVGDAQDYAIVQRVVAKGLSSGHGGASTCTPCPGGTYNDKGGEKCKRCPPGTFSQGEASECTPCAEGEISMDWGSKECFKCGEGTTAVNGVRCESDCKPKVQLPGEAGGAEEARLHFDLTPVQDKRVGPVLTNITDEEMANRRLQYRNSYYLSLCGIPKNETSCFNEEGYPMTTYGCRKHPGANGATDIGEIVGYESYIPKGGDSKDVGLRVTYTHGGDACGRGKVPRKTVIDLQCDPAAGVGAPVVTEEPDDDWDQECVHSFLWKTSMGCPVCRPELMDVVLTECVGGMRARKLVAKSGGCTPDPALELETMELCHREVTNTTFYVSLLLGAVAVFVVVPALGYFFIQYRKYRALYAQYAPVGTNENKLPFSDSEDEVAEDNI